MAFCITGADTNSSGFTLVDNAFLKDYMPNAPFCALKIYLFGLCLAGKNEDTNNIEQMRRTLNVSDDDILDAYTYWEECGLVNIVSLTPLVIEYIGASNRNIFKKVSAGKYKSFNKKMQQVLSGRMISVNEFEEYYSFLENSFFDPDALVEIAKYCVDMKANDIGFRYILKIARDWDKAGIKTVDKIREKIQTQNFYNEELSTLFKTLSTQRKIDIEDRRLYQKWTEEMGFLPEVILAVAKSDKKQNIQKLDNSLVSYYKQGLMSVKEISANQAQKEQNKNLAIEINRSLGLYYSDTRLEIEEYITPWLSLGFAPETLAMLAKFCFKCRITSLEGMDTKVKNLAQKGLIGQEAILNYTENILQTDKTIAEVLDALGVVRGVCAADRKNFNLWIQWGFSKEVIMFVADKCALSFNPMAALNNQLSGFKAEKTFNLSEIKNRITTDATAPSVVTKGKKSNDFLMSPNRTYTADQLNAMFEQVEEEV